MATAFLLANAAAAQPGREEDPRRFLRISTWHVSYSITVEGRGGYTVGEQYPGHYRWRIHRVYAGRYVLRQPTPGEYSGLDAPPGPLTANRLVGRYMGWGPLARERATPEAYLSPVVVAVNDREDGYGWNIDEITDILGPVYWSSTETWRAGGPEACSQSGVLGGVGLAVDVVAKKYAVRLPFGLRLPRSSPSVEHVKDAYAEGRNGPPDVSHETETGPLTYLSGPTGFSHGLSYGVTDQLPATGAVLHRKLVVPDVMVGGPWGLGGERYKVEVLLEWTCSPGPPADVSLVLMPDDRDSYARWRPKGATTSDANSFEQTPGNSVAVRAEVRGAGGVGTPAVKTHLIRFELVDVSREPGVCINDGFARGEPLPDLQFDQDRQPAGVKVQGDNGQAAVEVAQPGRSLRQSRAVISAYDYGAWGGVRAVAELTNGETVVGHVEGFPGTEALVLPEREPDSRVANAWLTERHASGQPDDYDVDSDPPGDGQGDGLNVFEEYRGSCSYQGDGIVWSDTDPLRKNLFVVDTLDTPWSAAGIGLLRTATRLGVIDRLDIQDLGPHGVVNYRHGAAPHGTDQHALVLVDDQGPWQWCNLRGAPVGTPKAFAETGVGVAAGLIPDAVAVRANGQVSAVDRRAVAVAHMLLHGCKVHDHGPPLKWVTWITKPRGGLLDPAALLEFADSTADAVSATPVQVLLDGRSRTSYWMESGTIRLLRSERGDASSGPADCLMRCWVDRCAVDPEDPETRHEVVNEKPGTRLCRSRKGDGYRGDAGFPGGNCAAQLRVNDGG